jgi:polar amino acid transport system substrate-binding protein
MLLASSVVFVSCSGTSDTATEGATTSEAPGLGVCTDAPYEPFEFGDEELTGFDVELVDAVAEQIDRSATFELTPLDQFEAALAAGTCELVVSALPVAEPGTSSLVFSTPYLAIDQALLVRADDAGTLPTFGSVAALPVGVVTDSPSADFAAGALPPDVQVVGFPTIDEAVDALGAGTVAAVVADAPVAGHLVIDDDRFAVTDTEPTDVRYGIAAGPAGTELLASVDQALATLEADGTLPDLRRTWFGS